ncbi:MAG: MarR family transcriptional regulator [Clostridia bacterium]|nr:MarR family transcriptional regulator [Clostridia bacterium]
MNDKTAHDKALLLDQQLCFRLYKASRLMIRLYTPHLDKLGLTYPQYLVLLVLWEKKSIGFKELGEQLQLKTGTLTPVVQRLIHSGYLSKEKHPEDDRKTCIAITQAGLDLIPEARKIPRELAKALNLTEAEFLDAIEMLDALNEKLMIAVFDE